MNTPCLRMLKEAWAREMTLYLSRHPIGMSSAFGIFSITLTLLCNKCLVTRHESSEKHLVCFCHIFLSLVNRTTPKKEVAFRFPLSFLSLIQGGKRLKGNF